MVACSKSLSNLYAWWQFGANCGRNVASEFAKTCAGWAGNASGLWKGNAIFFAHVVGVLCENCVWVALQVCKNSHPWWRFALQWQQFVCWRAKASTPAFSKQGCCFLHYFLQNLRCRFVGWRVDKLVNGKGQLFVAVQFHKLQVGLQLFLPLQNGTT